MKTKILLVLVIVVVLAVVLFVVFHKRHPAQHVTGDIIGVGLTMRSNAVAIQSVDPHTPAAEAGLHPGLIIQQIDGINTAGKTLMECFDMTSGPIGSKAQLVVIDPDKGETNIVEVTRGKTIIRDAH
jgi:C-terminal processing protease CtpA/Prc